MNLNKLHPTVKNVLLKVHQKHTATMGTSEKENHSLKNIKKVVVCDDHLKVYYKHEWYHYTPDGRWY